MTKIGKKIFQITVWYRYVIAGEQEKDFEVHDIEASDLQEAVNKASDLYRTHRTIPFQFLYNGEKQKPTIITKEDMFNLTAPVL
jgi:hypothetical protein